MSSNHEMMSIYISKNVALLALAKSILDGAGINYFINNDFFSNAYGTGGFGKGEIEIKVESGRFEEAKHLLSDIDKVEKEKEE